MIPDFGSVVDFLTCGSCQAEFPLSNILNFMQHKKSDCNIFGIDEETASLERYYSCYTCPQRFNAAVSLLQHAQYQHKQLIFKDISNAPSHLTSNKLSETKSERISQFQPNQNPAIQDAIKAHSNDSPESPPNEFDDLTEPFSKCCTSIVPKKRKRHIETKHKNRLNRKAASPSRSAAMPSDIYIDVDQSSADGEAYNDMVTKSRSHGGSSSDQRLVLKPGDVYKFPITSGTRNDYVGITYSDHDKTLRHDTGSTVTTSPGSKSSEVVPSNKNDNSNLSHTLSSKKKYPTSKPFKCDYCEHSFNQRIHLKKHLSKHTGVKPYKCGQCNYATVERSHLKVHIRIHTGEKPYKCDHCEYATAQNSTLKIHLKRHHGGVFLECSHCGKSFPEKQELVKHKQEHAKSGQSSSLELTSADAGSGFSNDSHKTEDHFQITDA